MSGSKPRRGLSSFLSNELKGSEAQVPEVAVVAPEAVPVPVAVVEAPREVVVTEVLIEVDEPAKAKKPAVKKPAAKASEAPVKAAKAKKPGAKPAVKKLAKPTKKPAKKPTAKKPAKKPAKKGKAAKKPAAKRASKAPLYLRLTRKEARLREDQIDGLAKVARRLTRAKGGSGSERLTENTLLRVAVDLLLAHADELDGTTESQLRASVLGK